MRVQGRIESGPSRSLVLDVYGSRPPVRPTSLLQGEVYLGAAPATITTDAQGKASFDVTLPVTTTPNLWVTATLTDVTGCAVAACGDTSEFAQRSVFAVAPRWGSATGQVPVTLVGQGFQPGASFAFGTTNANGVAFVDAQTLTGQLPLLGPGILYDVTVTNPDASTATMRKAFVTDFVDVPPSSVWYGSVMNIAAVGITSGCLPGQYCGTSEVTRAQMALFLTRGRHGPFFVPPPATGIFADVPLGAFAVDWIEQFYGEGITSGCAANPLRYCPDAAVTRAQMAVFLLRSKHGSSYVPPPCTGLFADVACLPPAHPFVNWIEQLAREGITAGCAAAPARYCPDASVLRLAMAAFIARTFGLDEATNQAPQVSAGANQTLTLPDSGSLSGAATDDGLPATPGSLTLAWSKQSGPGTVTFANPAAAWTTASFSAAGTYVLRLTADDGALSAFDETTVTVQAAGATNVPPTVNAGPDQVVTLPAVANLSGSASDDGLPNPPGSISVRWTQLSGPGTVTFGNFTAAVTTAGFSAPGAYVLRLSIDDGAITSVDDLQVTVNPDPGALPPEPSTVAPPYEGGVASDIAKGTQFLYTGPNPIQTGVAPGTIDERRVAVLRGRVLVEGGATLSGVKITILGHPQFGQTLSRADGRFDLAANGGGLLTVNYEKAGFLPVQRQVNAPWRDFRSLPDVVMIAIDAKVTTIASGAANQQVHRANPVADADGTRTATLMFPAGTTATMTLPDGATQPLQTMNVRATEYTVGADGPRRMPGELPPTTAYTYAVELSVDEAIAANAKRVTFSQPVAFYVDNFIGFPVGVIVPAGFYDRERGAWVPSDNGRVIKITAINAGVATVDTVGTEGLPAVAIPAAELQQLAALYPVGKELWRVPIPHFSAWDVNWGIFPPDDAVSPNQPPPSIDELLDEMCEAEGSIIECQNQVLGQRVPVVGTPYTLNYRSANSGDRLAAYTARIPLTGSAGVPPSATAVRLTVNIAGRSIEQVFPPGPNVTATFTWDGLDAYGRKVQGRTPVSFDVGYEYEPLYQRTSRFGTIGNGALITGTTRAGAPGLVFHQVTQRTLGAFDARSLGLGGWTIDEHHVHDPDGNLLSRGDGSRVSGTTPAMGAVLRTIAGGSTTFDDGDGGPARGAFVDGPERIALAADGALYIAQGGASNRVRRVAPDGTIDTIIGKNPPPGCDDGTPLNCGDGGPATQAGLLDLTDVAVGPDGSVYLADQGRVRRIGPDGIITTVAGTGFRGLFNGDGIPATQAVLDNIFGVAIGPDGSLYIADIGHRRVRRVAPDGLIGTIAGNGDLGGNPEGIPAVQAKIRPRDVAVAPDGSVYVIDAQLPRIYRIGVDGLLTTFAGTNQTGFNGDGIPATQAQISPFAVEAGPDGRVYITEVGRNDNRIRRVEPDGTIVTVVGTGTFVPFSADGTLAPSATIDLPFGVAVAPDGRSIYFAERGNDLVRQVAPALPGFDINERLVASPDGGQLYVFSSAGRHLRTLHALTGATLREFTYDAAGRLTSITEKTGGTDNVTTVQYDVSGKPTKIVGPYGQQTLLAVDANGFLNAITNPASETVAATYSAGGLMQTYTDPRGKVRSYQFDAEGRLVKATDPTGAFKTLARTGSDSNYTVTKTSPLGRVTTYQVERVLGGRKQTITAPGGEKLEALQKDDGTTIVAKPDGTTITTILGPDPRWGMLAPVAKSTALQVPSGLSRTIERSIVATLSNPLDLLSLTGIVETTIDDGRTTTTTYAAANRTFTTASPAGRSSTITLDAFGRVTRSQLGTLAPTATTFDNRGRTSTIVRGTGGGARTASLTYGADGYFASLVDPLGRTFSATFDAAGRMSSHTMADGATINFAYDPAGNRISLQPPGRSPHLYGFSDRDELMLVAPPTLPGTGPFTYAYDSDGAVTSLADAATGLVQYGYDAAGRNASRALSKGAIAIRTDGYSYDAQGRRTGIASTAGTTHAFGYDGSLDLGETVSGALTGSIAYGYDTAFRPVSESLNGGTAVAWSYDADDFVVGAGLISISRDPVNGLPVDTSLGTVATTRAFNVFAEETAYSVTVGANALFAYAVARDALGRITQFSETVAGVTKVIDYSYDARGQVASVREDGILKETYAYDANGNRILATVGSVSAAASHDGQDRLLQSGPATYSYDAAGRLATKVVGVQTTTYSYDPLGALRSVALASGTTVAYLNDGQGRRVGRTVSGTLVQQFVYRDRTRPAAELDGAGNVVSRFVYGDGQVPLYVVRGASTFRLLTDPRGSVRFVVDVDTGVVAQQLGYDTWGNVVLDTNPGFQPFGFAGGLYDVDTRLVRFGARDYDPESGRWTARDPIGFAGRDANLFRYSSNDPVNRADPTGMADWLDATVGFLTQAQVELMYLVNPALMVNDLVRDVAEALGADDMVSYADLVHGDLPGVDESSVAYAEGSFIASCAALVGSIAAGGGGALKGIAARSAQEAKVAETAAKSKAAWEGRRAAKAAKEAQEGAIDVVKGEQRGGGVAKPKPQSGYMGR